MELKSIPTSNTDKLLYLGNVGPGIYWQVLKGPALVSRTFPTGKSNVLNLQTMSCW